MEGTSERPKVDSGRNRPRTNHNQMTGLKDQEFDWLKNTNTFNPMKTSNMFRDMGNYLLKDSSACLPGSKQLGAPRPSNRLDDTVDNLLQKYTGGRLEGTYRGLEGTQLQPIAVDSSVEMYPGRREPVRAYAGRGGRQSSDSGMGVGESRNHEGSDLRDTVDIKGIIAKNEDRARLLERYGGMGTIEEGMEGTNESIQGLVEGLGGGKNRAGYGQRGGGNQESVEVGYQGFYPDQSENFNKLLEKYANL